MRLTASYKVRLKGLTRADKAALKATVETYRDAVGFLVGVVDEEWDAVEALSSKARVNAVERAVHATRKNPLPKHGEFDRLFYKLPSYLRRAAISNAVGAVSSYRSSLASWEGMTRKERRGKRPPRLGGRHHPAPTFFKGNMFDWDGEGASCRLKVLRGGDWAWLDVRLKPSDVRYVQARSARWDRSCPTLERRGKEWSLRFAFEAEVELADAPAHERRVCAVDLGVNMPATLVAMDPDGTVVGRRFVRLPSDIDRLERRRGRVRKAQRRGARKPRRLWALANAANRRLADRTAQEVVDFAALYSCDAIVLEHLDLEGKKKGSRKQRLALWRKLEVQRMVAHRAHALGMRVGTVNPWGTSSLAFDGSGAVYRGAAGLDRAVADGVISPERRAKLGNVNSRVCVFPTGKVYDADLNAAYNIAARYIVRAMLESLPETAKLAAQAKVPGCAKRTTCTLSSLIDLGRALAA